MSFIKINLIMIIIIIVIIIILLPGMADASDHSGGGGCHIFQMETRSYPGLPQTFSKLIFFLYQYITKAVVCAILSVGWCI